MKKGDLKKQEIMQTAEQMFCRKGYEQTSIQDILDQLGISKGSFYHHFVSKEVLLEAMCSKRAEQNMEITLSDASEQISATGKLNHLLSRMIPLQDEKLSFVLMLLPTFILPEGKILITSYCESLKKAFINAVAETIDEGVAAGEMICGNTEIFADIIITLINRLWVSVCDIIIENETEGNKTDPAELLHITEQYRTAVERILTITYGSLVLIDIPDLKGLTDQIHMHWNTK